MNNELDQQIFEILSQWYGKEFLRETDLCKEFLDLKKEAFIAYKMDVILLNDELRKLSPDIRVPEDHQIWQDWLKSKCYKNFKKLSDIIYQLKVKGI